MRSYTRALWLAAALGLLLGVAASCVAVPTETPSPTAATPPTAVAAAAATPTTIPCTPCATSTPPPTATVTNTPLPTATATNTPPPTATAVPPAVAGVAATPSSTPLPTATGAPPTTIPTATSVPPTAVPTATSAPPAVAPAATTAPQATAPATSTTVPTAAPTIAATQTMTATPVCCVGQRCVVDGAAFTVRDVTTGQAVSGIATPRPGQTLLVAGVTIENLGSQPLAYGAQDFKVRAADGAEYGASTVVTEQAGTPGPGEVVRLRVVFDVPESASGFTLIYSPPTLGTQQVQVDLSCSQPGPSPTPTP